MNNPMSFPVRNNLPLAIRSYTGRWIRITAVCVGGDAANLYMEQHPGESLVATEGDPSNGGLCLLARTSDKGEL